MRIEINEISEEEYELYSQIPIKFEVRSKYRLENIDQVLGGIKFFEEKVDHPYIKDYDSISDYSIERWGKEFDISSWGIFIAELDGIPVGGVGIAYDTEGVNMLDGRDDISVIWDIRIHPEHRGEGIGSKLFDHAVEWSIERDCKYLKVETQNINVPACKFYVSKGCELGYIDKYAYYEEGLEDEVKLVWFRELK
ncbi:MAG: GNAT family N-acetyltransferase [Thermoplasmatota archaeon]